MVAVLTLIIGLLTGYLIHNEINEYKMLRSFERTVKITRKGSGE